MTKHINSTCTYIGHTGTQATCCEPTVLGSSYCATHYPMIYASGTRLGRRLKDARRAEAIRQLVSDFNAAVEELEASGFDVYGDSERLEVEVDFT